MHNSRRTSFSRPSVSMSWNVSPHQGRVPTTIHTLVGPPLPQEFLTQELSIFVNDPKEPTWPTLHQVSKLSPDFCQQTRKAPSTAKLKLQAWTKGPAPQSTNKRHHLAKHIRTLVRGLPLPGAPPRTQGAKPQDTPHAPRTLPITRYIQPKPPPPIAYIPAEVFCHYIVPCVGNPKTMLALFLSSNTMLEKVSLLGSFCLECLDQVWWKLRKITASLGTGDPVVMDSSSGDDPSDTPPFPSLRETEKTDSG